MATREEEDEGGLLACFIAGKNGGEYDSSRFQ